MQITHPNKISRLDELLNRNQAIYQNLRTRLLEINQSNEKINANINIIKPLYDDYPHESTNYQNQSQSPIMSEYHINSIQSQNIKEEIISPKFHEIQEQANDIRFRCHESYNRQTYNNYNQSEHFDDPQVEDKQHQVRQDDQNIENHQRHLNYQRYLRIDGHHQSHKNNIKSSRFDNQQNYDSFECKDLEHECQKSCIAHHQQSAWTEKCQQQENQMASSCVYIPFNKLFRSPVMKIQKNNEIIVARKCKTKISSNQANRIIDGMKYKNDNIITDQNELLRFMYENQNSTKKIGLIGGGQSQKKKLHMDIINYIYAGLTDIVMKKGEHQKIQFEIEHQQAVSGQEPSVIKELWIFQSCLTQNKLNLLAISNVLQAIVTLIKKKFTFQSKQPLHRIRITKMMLYSDESLIQKSVILSSNKVEAQFLKSLALNQIVWCINPLHKYHDESIATLDQMKQYEQTKKEMRKALRKLPIFEYLNRSENLSESQCEVPKSVIR